MPSAPVRLTKAPSGIPGLDEVTDGGLPRGRTALVCGTAGCGKTLFGLQFLVSGAADFDEPGVLISFEESLTDIVANAASIGWDLEALQAAGKLEMDFVDTDPHMVLESGGYDLEGLFLRLAAAVDRIGAKRVVIDTPDVIFSALQDQTTMRSEIRRLFRWLKDRGLTAVVTAERGIGPISRTGLEEYVSDCVIVLDHRVEEQTSTRRMRVVKYRGSSHVTDEIPFMIDRDGLRVMPFSSISLEHEAPIDRISTGVQRLDAMLGEEGYFRGGSILITGTPGVGKTTLAASFLDAGAKRGERGLLLTFEESPKQLIRNLRSVGLDLQSHIDAGFLRIVATRPSKFGLEAHLASIIRTVEDFEPTLIVLDPASALLGQANATHAMLTRLIDWLKRRQITSVFTSLSNHEDEASGVDVSSVIDAWLRLESLEENGERNRTLRVIKARGAGHSNQVRELIISSEGVTLADVYAGDGAMVLGTARRAREAELARQRQETLDRSAIRKAQFERRQTEIQAQITALEGELAAESAQMALEEHNVSRALAQAGDDRDALLLARHADVSASQ